MAQQFDISDMVLYTGVWCLCTFNIVSLLIYHLLLNLWKASTPTVHPSLLMFHTDHPTAWISWSLVLYRVPRSGSFTLAETVITWTHIGAQEVCESSSSVTPCIVMKHDGVMYSPESWMNVVLQENEEVGSKGPGTTQEMNLSIYRQSI